MSVWGIIFFIWERVILELLQSVNAPITKRYIPIATIAAPHRDTTRIAHSLYSIWDNRRSNPFPVGFTKQSVVDLTGNSSRISFTHSKSSLGQSSVFVAFPVLTLIPLPTGKEKNAVIVKHVLQTEEQV